MSLILYTASEVIEQVRRREGDDAVPEGFAKRFLEMAKNEHIFFNCSYEEVWKEKVEDHMEVDRRLQDFFDSHHVHLRTCREDVSIEAGPVDRSTYH